MRRLLPTTTLLALGLAIPATAVPASAATAHKHHARREGAAHSASTWTALTAALSATSKPTVVRHASATGIAPMSTLGVAIFGSKVLRAAAKENGHPYVYGAAGPEVFDCSGFTRFVYAQMGIALPHSSYAQYAMTEHIPLSAARPGDLVFMRGLGHVGIYAGHGTMWDAPSTGDHVRHRAIYGAYTVGRVKRSH